MFIDIMLQLIFGNLVPQMEQLHSVLGARSESDNGGKLTTDPPGVLAICNGAPWFPPLAVTLPTRNLSLIPIKIPDKMQVSFFLFLSNKIYFNSIFFQSVVYVDVFKY